MYNIIYSSGTTGDPKGIIHTHHVRSLYGTLFANAWRMTPESVVLQTGSIVFNGSFLTLMPWMYLGCSYILHKAFDPVAMIATIARERVTHMMMVPAQIVAMLNHPAYDPARMTSVEMIMSVGAPLHREHKQRLNATLPGVFYELYGLTEGFVTILDKYDVRRKEGSVGVLPPFFEMRIVDDNGADLPPRQVGEIVGRGPIMMPGYYKRPDLTAGAIVGGWLFTGDLGYVDEDGFLFLVDRKKESQERHDHHRRGQCLSPRCSRCPLGRNPHRRRGLARPCRARGDQNLDQRPRCRQVPTPARCGAGDNIPPQCRRQGSEAGNAGKIPCGGVGGFVVHISPAMNFILRTAGT